MEQEVIGSLPEKPSPSLLSLSSPAAAATAVGLRLTAGLAGDETFLMMPPLTFLEDGDFAVADTTRLVVGEATLPPERRALPTSAEGEVLGAMRAVGDKRLILGLSLSLASGAFPADTLRDVRAEIGSLFTSF